MSLLTVQGLSVQFHKKEGTVEAVRSVSFTVERGEIVGVVGESGSGKSSLMRAVMGLLPESAEVSFEQCRITGGTEKLAMVFQDPLTYLNPTVKVGRQITETIRAHRTISRAEARERAIELMELAGIRNAGERMDQYPFELSGGQRQRIVLTIALACEPELLIADEPTTALDVTVQRQILERLKRIAGETGMAVLIVSHDPGVIASLADRVLVMKDGRILESGPAEEVFCEPEHSYTEALLRYAKKARMGRRQEKPEDPVEILRAEHLTKRYRKRMLQSGIHRNRMQGMEAVREVSFSLYQGETFGIVGESGCGKTTLAGMLAGIVEPTAGRLTFHGEPLPSLERGRTRGQTRKVQMVFQDISASLDPRCTVGEILEEPLAANGIGTREERCKKVREFLEQVGLAPEDAEKYPRAFSGGERQRIGLARALIPEPEILVLDEPVSALDAAIQEQILELLEEIRRKKQLTYVFISHDLNVVRRISLRLGVMYAGRFVESGDTKAVYEDPWHPYTKALLSAVLPVEPAKARKQKRIQTLEEAEPSEHDTGCPYAPRCGYAMECCKRECPGVYRFGTREVSCFLYSEQHTGRRSAAYKMGTQI